MKEFEKQPAAELPAESSPQLGSGAEFQAAADRIVKRYVEAGNRLYEEYRQLKLDEFESEHRFASDQARCAAMDDFRCRHYDLPLDALREECVAELMPSAREDLRRRLQGISFPLE